MRLSSLLMPSILLANSCGQTDSNRNKLSALLNADNSVAYEACAAVLVQNSDNSFSDKYQKVVAINSFCKAYRRNKHDLASSYQKECSAKSSSSSTSGSHDGNATFLNIKLGMSSQNSYSSGDSSSEKFCKSESDYRAAAEALNEKHCGDNLSSDEFKALVSRAQKNVSSEQVEAWGQCISRLSKHPASFTAVGKVLGDDEKIEIKLSLLPASNGPQIIGGDLTVVKDNLELLGQEQESNYISQGRDGVQLLYKIVDKTKSANFYATLSVENYVGTTGSSFVYDPADKITCVGKDLKNGRGRIVFKNSSECGYEEKVVEKKKKAVRPPKKFHIGEPRFVKGGFLNYFFNNPSRAGQLVVTPNSCKVVCLAFGPSYRMASLSETFKYSYIWDAYVWTTINWKGREVPYRTKLSELKRRGIVYARVSKNNSIHSWSDGDRVHAHGCACFNPE